MKYILSILLLFIIGCNNNSHSQKDIATLYVDVLIAEETYKTKIDSIQIVLDSLYNYHKINEGEYLKALEEYRHTEETWNEFFVYAEEYLDTLKAIENRKIKK